ncbi:tellurite resistance TerB family protein [Vibrio sp. RC27]
MFSAITSLFKELLDGNDLSRSNTDNPNLAIACMLTEVSGADYEVDAAETNAKRHLLATLTQLPEQECDELLRVAQDKTKNSVSLYDFTSQLRELTQEQRYSLIKAMWDVAHADGVIDPLEDAVIRKSAELLYVDHSLFIRAKLSSGDESAS